MDSIVENTIADKLFFITDGKESHTATDDVNPWKGNAERIKQVMLK